MTNHMKNISRRVFLKRTSEAGAGAAAGLTLARILKGAAATGLAIEAARNLTGCATMESGSEENVIYPPLSGKKIQPPEYGCFLECNIIGLVTLELIGQIRTLNQKLAGFQ